METPTALLSSRKIEMLNKTIQKDWVGVAKIGRSVGFRGEVLLYLLSDFPQSLQSGNTYFSHFGNLTLEHYSPQKSIVKFKEINSKEETRAITNLILYTTQEQSKIQCKLGENEFFWFEIVGSGIVEQGELLGIVSEIERFNVQDYLSVKTHSTLTAQNLPKSFLIPYTERYILSVDSTQNPKIIHTQFCKEILENS